MVSPERIPLYALLAIVWLAQLLASTSCDAAELRVEVNGIESDTGEIRFNLFDKAGYEPRDPVRTYQVVPEQGRATWQVKDLPEGRYAVIVIHDLNLNGKLDYSVMGPPVEPVAFSNGARAVMSAPGFEAAAFPVAEGTENIEQITLRSNRGRWSLGLGMITGTTPYRGVEGRFIVVPIVGYESERISWRGPSLELRPFPWETITPFLTLETRFSGYDNSDSSRLRGMKDREPTLEAGGGLRYRIADDWTLTGKFLRDVLGVHRGQTFEATLEHSIPTGNWTFTPSATIQLLSNRHADYYFGVRRPEAEADRPSYNPGSSTNGRFGLGINYRSPNSWMILANMNVEVFDSSINDSPIVARDTVFNFLLGWVYVF